jgi:hypothetical protein
MHPAIVLVHGAFAESASWDAVITSLLEAATVLAAANPLRGLAAGAGQITGLVYLGDFVPASGENRFTLTGLYPGSTLEDRQKDVSPSDGTTDLSITQDRFHAQSPADLPVRQAALRAAGLAWAAAEQADGCDQGVPGGPVSWPQPGRHLQGGAQPAGRAVDGLGGRLIGRAAQQGLYLACALVQAGGDPQLQLRVERAVAGRAVRGGAHLSVRAVHRASTGLG